MAPDLRTVLAMLAASALLMSVVLCVGIRTRRADGFLKWNLGLGLLAAGWLLATLRGWLPDVAAVAASGALLLAGFCLQFTAVAEFGQQRARRALWLLPGPLLLFALLLLYLRSPVVLTVAASLACAAALAGTGTAARRLAGGGAPRRMLVLACDAGALILLARAAAAVFLPRLRADFFPAVESAALIGLFMTCAAASIGFLLLHRERAEAGLTRLAAYDPLTQTFNRLAFINLAEGQVARARRSGEPCTLLVLDLDRFERVNELSRDAHDRVLRELSALLRGGLRASDLTGRYGGKEFCVLLTNTTLDAGREVAERLRSTVAARRLGGVAPAVTVSIGVAPCEAQRAGALHVAIASAEQALRGAMKDGANRVAGPVQARRVRRAA